MEKEISNQGLAVLLLVAVVVSIGGTVISLNRLSQLKSYEQPTGFATSPTATATVVVTSVSSLVFTVSTVAFGTGSVNTTGGNKICSIGSKSTGGSNDGDAMCIGFNDTTVLPLHLMNDGSTNMSVNLTCDKTAATFIGGAEVLELFNVKISNNESNSCPAGAIANTGWTTVTTTNMMMCNRTFGGLAYSDEQDTMFIDVNITVPYDVDSSRVNQPLIATFTATGTSM